MGYSNRERTQDGTGRTVYQRNRDAIKQTQAIEKAALIGGGFLLGKAIKGGTKASFSLGKWFIKAMIWVTVFSILITVAFYAAIIAAVVAAVWYGVKYYKKRKAIVTDAENGESDDELDF